eukprot:GHVS01028571.1.p1 GENE.GHVS01028571.1~~GHVS01028571.1.p1  ORF type:complete len:159 (+),score=8.86 GHVS01028571.1:150-626(+)
MEEDGGGKMTLSLLETKAMMLNELERMHITHQHLVKSSQDISQNDEIFARYAKTASCAGSLLFYMKRRSEMDSLWVWYSFVFFVSVCLFIIGKRFAVWRFLFGLVWLAIRCAFTTVQVTVGLIIQTVSIPEAPPPIPICPIPLVPLTMYENDNLISSR